VFAYRGLGDAPSVVTCSKVMEWDTRTGAQTTGLRENESRVTLSDQEAKVKRASSNPFEHLQNRQGRQGLGYRVPEHQCSDSEVVGKSAGVVRTSNTSSSREEEEAEASQKETANNTGSGELSGRVLCRGRPRRSKSGKARDAQRRDLYIKSKINENTKRITNSLAATAAGIANSYGQQVLQQEKIIKKETFSFARKFIFEHCKADSLDVSTEGGWKKFAKHVKFNVPSESEMFRMPFDKIRYIGRLSPELLRLFVMYRVCVNGMTYIPLSDDRFGERGTMCLPRYMKNGMLLSEIATGIKNIGERLMRLCVVKVFSTDPQERGDQYYDETMLAQDTAETGI